MNRFKMIAWLDRYAPSWRIEYDSAEEAYAEERLRDRTRHGGDPEELDFSRPRWDTLAEMGGDYDE
jgi:hypothetical protein